MSRLPVGSSARISDGWLTIARAIAARWRWPPESSDGRCFARSSEAHARERFARALLALRAREPGVEQRQLDVALERGLGEQVEGLEHEADLLVADPGELEARQRRDVVALEQVAPVARRVQAAEDVHQRRLARARRADHRDHLSLLDAQVDARAAPGPRARPRRRSWSPPPCGSAARPRRRRASRSPPLGIATASLTVLLLLRARRVLDRDLGADGEALHDLDLVDAREPGLDLPQLELLLPGVLRVELLGRACPSCRRRRRTRGSRPWRPASAPRPS